jgi:signal transduction histidine kinase
MANFNLENFPLCDGAEPTLFTFLDITIVPPPMLFYAYIPILVLSLFFGMFVFLKDKKSLRSQLFLLISIFFSLWIIAILLQWTLIHVHFVHFAWQLTALLEVPIFIFAFYFIYAFLYKNDLPDWVKWSLVLLGVPIILLTATVFNVKDFDIITCEGKLGVLWDYVYALEAVLIFITAYIGFRGILQQKDAQEKTKNTLLVIGTILFLSIFYLSNLFGEIYQVYSINLFGPLGMLIFLVCFTYIIVRFKAIDIRIFGVQALVVALWFLLFSLLFIHTISLVNLMVGITLILLTIVGTLLIRGFSREVKQREEITLLAQDLQKANARLKELDKQKSEFVSLASHQLRGPITAVNGYVSLILAGDYGDVTPNIKEALEKVQTASKDLGLLVGDYLDITRIELGRMKYEFADVSLTKIAQDVCDQMSQVALHNGLTLSTEISTEAMLVHADANKLKQVMLNLVDNAVKYTPQGSITVAVRAVAGKAQFSVKDSGTGMSTKVLDSIFEKFVRAPGAQRVNATGTGLGLFVARKIITEHKGRIWAESAGEGKGSTFSFEIDLKA